MRGRLTVRALAVVAVFAAAVVVPATAAYATPSGCSSSAWFGSGTQEGWQAGCTHFPQPGQDWYQAVATCQRIGHPSVRKTVNGPVIRNIPYPKSIAHCASGYEVVGGTMLFGQF